MLGLRGSNWVGFWMLVIMLFIHEPIWLFVFSDSANVLWAIPVAAYIIVAVVFLLRGSPVRD